MSNKQIPFEVNLNKFTIKLSMAKKIDPEAKAGTILALKNVIDPSNDRVIDVRLLVIDDEGISN